MTIIIHGPDELRARAGRELGVSDWTDIQQQAVDTFADLTGDHQWIHVDVERAQASPFGGTIVHGYLTLGLVPRLASTIYRVEGFAYGLNYGVNKVRFPAPLPVGRRVRLRTKLSDVSDVPRDGLQVVLLHTFEREAGGARPVCVAEAVVRYYP
jgi:acyl dehydratase